MPTYEFYCEKCKKAFNVIISISDYVKKKYNCPKCKGKKVKQQISSFQTVTSKKSQIVFSNSNLKLQQIACYLNKTEVEDMQMWPGVNYRLSGNEKSRQYKKRTEKSRRFFIHNVKLPSKVTEHYVLSFFQYMILLNFSLWDLMRAHYLMLISKSVYEI